MDNGDLLLRYTVPYLLTKEVKTLIKAAPHLSEHLKPAVNPSSPRNCMFVVDPNNHDGSVVIQYNKGRWGACTINVGSDKSTTYLSVAKKNWEQFFLILHSASHHGLLGFIIKLVRDCSCHRKRLVANLWHYLVQPALQRNHLHIVCWIFEEFAQEMAASKDISTSLFESMDRRPLMRNIVYTRETYGTATHTTRFILQALPDHAIKDFEARRLFFVFMKSEDRRNFEIVKLIYNRFLEPRGYDSKSLLRHADGYWLVELARDGCSDILQTVLPEILDRLLARKGHYAFSCFCECVVEGHIDLAKWISKTVLHTPEAKKMLFDCSATTDVRDIFVDVANFMQRLCKTNANDSSKVECVWFALRDLWPWADPRFSSTVATFNETHVTNMVSESLKNDRTNILAFLMTHVAQEQFIVEIHDALWRSLPHTPVQPMLQWMLEHPQYVGEATQRRLHLRFEDDLPLVLSQTTTTQ